VRVAPLALLFGTAMLMHDGIAGCSHAAALKEEQEQLRTIDGLITQYLGSAPTLLQVAKVMRAGPDSCFPSSPGMQLCTWKARSKLLPYAPPPDQLKIRGDVWTIVTCELPTGGNPSAPGTCIVNSAPAS